MTAVKPRHVAVQAVLTSLPERFRSGQHTEQFQAYTAQRWSATGYRRLEGIAYNPEHKPDKGEDNRYRWVEHPSDGLRLVGKVHEIRTGGSLSDNRPYIERSLVDHTGWWLDPFGDGETACGEVYQLPSRNGKNQYVPAVGDPYGNDGALVDFHSVTDDLRDAIRWADGMAERYADDEREYQAKQMAADRIEAIKAEIGDTYRELHSLCREIRANCKTVEALPEINKLIRSHYRRARSSVRKLRAEMRKIEQQGLDFS